MWTDGTFRKELPEKQPMMAITVQILEEEHHTHTHDDGQVKRKKQKFQEAEIVDAIADTGAQTCTSGI